MMMMMMTMMMTLITADNQWGRDKNIEAVLFLSTELNILVLKWCSLKDVILDSDENHLSDSGVVTRIFSSFTTEQSI